MPSLTLAVWIMLKLAALGAGIGAGIALVVRIARSMETLDAALIPQRQLEADLPRATERLVSMQDRGRFRGPQAYRNAEGADWPRGAA